MSWPRKDFVSRDNGRSHKVIASKETNSCLGWVSGRGSEHATSVGLHEDAYSRVHIEMCVQRCITAGS